MAEYMVERYMPGVTAEDVSIGVTNTKLALEAMAAEGTTIRYLRGVLVPSEESVFFFFEGPSVGSVEEANRRAEFPFDRVVEVIPIP